MSNIRMVMIVSAFGFLATTGVAAAQQVPNPANPHPASPIATDGTPLPAKRWASGHQTVNEGVFYGLAQPDVRD